MIRPLLALERLSFLDPAGKVGYRHGENGAEQETMDYLEFIARVTSHIPDKGQVMVRYYGPYANARHLRLPSRNVSGPPIPQPNIFPDCSRAQRERSGRFRARPSPPAAAEPYRVVLLASLTSPEPGFMLVRGGGMGNRHEIRSASGLRRKANSYPSRLREGDASWC
jgi:hypothetical protein